MGKALDLSNQTFGRLTVLSFSHVKGNNRSNQRRIWNCICSCGQSKQASTNDLRSGRVKSCGCLHKESSQSNATHGYTKRINGKYQPDPTYQAWQNLKVHSIDQLPPEWINSFEQFLADVGERPTPDHRLHKHYAREDHGPTNTYWRSKEDIEDRKDLGLPDDLAIDITRLLD